MPSRHLLAVVSAALLIAAHAQAALMLDFGETGAPAGELEPGFSAFQVTNATNYQGTFFDYAGTGLDNGTPLRVTIDGTATAAGAQRMVDRGTTGWTGGQNALLRDWIGIDARSTTPGNGTDTIVRIANLQPGFYQIKSYHTDISTGGNQSAQLDYLVGGQLLVDNFQVRGQVAGGGNSTTVPNFFEAVLPAEAATPVAMTYRVPTTALGDKGFPVLNGFELVKLNETPVVAVDFNDRANAGAAHTQAGFGEFLLAGAEGSLQTTTTRSFGSIDVTLNMPTGTMDDRRRTEPTNSGAFTEQLLLRDFVFASDIAGAETMEVVVDGVRPNTLHGITIWSFDDGSPGARTTDWTVNGVLAFDNYAFNGSAVPPAPANNDIYSFSFTGTSNALGQLVLRGIGQSTASPQVFLNALRVVDLEAPAIPEPATAALGLIALAALASRRRSA